MLFLFAVFLDQQKTAPYEAQSDLRPCLRLSHGNKDKVVVVGAQKSGRAGTGSVYLMARVRVSGRMEEEKAKRGRKERRLLRRKGRRHAVEAK